MLGSLGGVLDECLTEVLRWSDGELEMKLEEQNTKIEKRDKMNQERGERGERGKRGKRGRRGK